jgi:hypothetical protein
MKRADMKAWLFEKKLQYPLPRDFNVAEYIAAGVVPKNKLVDGCYYYGLCRNAEVAQWVAAKHCFVYMRCKFGFRFPEDILHLEDDNGFDLFVPLGVAEEIKPEEMVK